MFRFNLSRHIILSQPRLIQVAAHLYHAEAKQMAGFTLADLPKSSVFTSKLPPDPAFDNPAASHAASRETLGPRLVKGALYTFVRPEQAEDAELLGVSQQAMRDLGLKPGEEQTEEFKSVVSGNKFYWSEDQGGVYPWAQCYGGWQFGSWAGQLGDGRAISLFETTNPRINIRYELQLKGAGRTPYSRFADGKAVLRSSIREYVVSEALNALRIPTTRALSLTLLPKSQVLRERIEPGAIVARFAETWLRIGSFDILHARGDRDLVRKLATFVAEDVFQGWQNLPAKATIEKESSEIDNPPRNISPEETQGEEGYEENRFARLYREIVRRNAKTVAAWQAYGFMNGVLNTDNTSIYGLSLDFGPFAFMDNFDANYTPNHDDHMLRYSFKNQPSVIWWNLVRLGEAFGELIGAGGRVDDEVFISKGVTEEYAPILVKRAEAIIEQTGEEFRAVFHNEYKRLMTARLGLKVQKESDFQELFSGLLDLMEDLELDFNHFFRRLSCLSMDDLNTEDNQKSKARLFFHDEGMNVVGENQDSAEARLAKWLNRWQSRVVEDWGSGKDDERCAAMKQVNPKFLPRSWVLDEVIDRVEKKGDREILGRVMQMALSPFNDKWDIDREEEERFCGDVPRFKRAMMCSCSS